MEKLVESGQLSRDLDPLVVVGAGLSAADAILYALERGIPVVHVFRRDIKDPNLALGKLPAALYPEYHHIHRLMTGKEEADGYVAYPSHSVAQFLEDQQILLKNQHNCDIIIKTACVLVSIGSRPNLSFLPKEGRNLGIIKGMAIDSKHNPIDVDPITYQSRKQCGLYAMGPLVGENFVRFLRGGALAITSHLCKKREGKL
jgi:thioredoxin reductase